MSKAKAESATVSKRVRLMFFGFSLHSWENAMVALLIIAGFFALLAGIATWAVVRLQRIEIAESNARQKEAELKIEELRKIAGPRSINHGVFARELEGKPKSRVQVWYLPEISDGFWLATQIVSALIEAHWELVEPPRPVPESQSSSADRTSQFIPRLMALGAQPNGVTVVAHGTPADIDKDNPSQFALMAAIAKGMGTSANGGFNLSVPQGVLRVIIAAKPDPILPPSAVAPSPK